MVSVSLHKNQSSAYAASIWLCFLGVEMTKISRAVQFIPQVLRDTFRQVSKVLRHVAFALAVRVCALIGSCTAYFQAYDNIAHAELRARENSEAARIVQQLGIDAEAQYKRIGTVPSKEELNCFRKPCDGVYFITQEVVVDGNGVIHAKFRKLGVPFAPTSQFTVTWNSTDRSTNRDFLVSPWSWRLLSVLWFALSALIVLLPWLPRISRSYLRHRHSPGVRSHPGDKLGA